MPIGWMTALKLVPWGDVIEATPQVLQAARKLMRSSKAETEPDAQGLADGQTPSPLEQLQARVQRLEAEQRASAELIQSLAEQQAVVVQAVEALRRRNRLLVAAIALLGIVCAGLLSWALQR